MMRRKINDRILFGVCSGIAAEFGIDPLILRLAFAAAFLFFGLGPIAYIVLALIMPREKIESSH